MGLVKLHFVGFSNDMFFYNPVFVRADKIAAIAWFPGDLKHSLPKMEKDYIVEGGVYMSDIDNELDDTKTGSEIIFEKDYVNYLLNLLIIDPYNPRGEQNRLVTYESPEEIIRLINGENVPLEVISRQERIVIDELDLTVRTTNRLRAAGIDTISDLIKLTEVELIIMSGLGKKSLTDIKDKLAERGFYLGMKAV
ncbi:TPA: DNA-directed RNA polymerase subunit alpha C-terminal domain-containing protein [Pasteurella multocida]|uniref:DNA-directed RNA polymerase subunit alpha C-terminal domain-containing protein n=1 Tax=Pasteurella multocida TaxID=747 RepID=UPI00189849CB|nr:DNA-directed RNA polymerase subunit alpha C-terminal domain-containing protein [Pasteurella multocida]MBF6983752.1 hypothetical protein [Pasteurella multocida]